MKKCLLLIIFHICGFYSLAQTPSLQDKLYYTCKIWGFVKYYHSEVSTCHTNWDSVLLSVLPAVRAAGTINDFNDVIDTMLAAAGPTTLSTTYFPDTIAPELKRNRDFSWISSPVLRSDVQISLDTIKNNFRPHAECWVQDNPHTTSYAGTLILPYDDTELIVNTTIAYPGSDERLLMFFKYWNVVRYFYPHNYVLDIPWDSTLNNFVLKIDAVSNAEKLFYLYLNINTALNDAHVAGLTYSSAFPTPPGYMQPPIRLKYIEGKYVVVKSAVAGIYPGDAIVSKDGLTVSQWEDSLNQYYSSGNPAVLRRFVYENLLGRPGGSEALVVEDSTGVNHTFIAPCNDYGYYNYDTVYYPNDSLGNISWTSMGCNTGYVNMGNLQHADVNAMYTALSGKGAIIFDMRNYPNATELAIAKLMLANRTEYMKFMIPDVTYPGTFSWKSDSAGVDGNPTPYTGKVIILIDEVTQSQAEFSSMILESMPDVIKIGSQTAGTDGNISYWNLSQDINTGFTSQAIYYPNGDSTQRIGIVPDLFVYPTRAGVRHGDDEVLNKALMVACSAAGVRDIHADKTIVQVFPNPADDLIVVEVKNATDGKIDIMLTDITGRQMLHKEAIANIRTFLDAGKLAGGLYFVTVRIGARQYVSKIVKN
ncbi:MAG: hypothetical protein JWQ38_2018 [Flavipsychrobacter sp.]|nr:hypothetical protein [Flavipsychrobacter sp.]